MAERAPASVWFYLEAPEAALFRALYPIRLGQQYDAAEHDTLIERGLLEIEEFNRQPDGTCLNDVRLTRRGEAELTRMAKLAAEEFENRRRAKARGPGQPNSPAVERPSGREAPASEIRRRQFSAGRASRPVPVGKSHRAQAGTSTPGEAAPPG